MNLPPKNDVLLFKKFSISPATVYSSIKNVKNTLNESVTIQFDTSTIRRNIAVYRHYLQRSNQMPIMQRTGFSKI